MQSGMTSHLFALCFDANDPAGLARFWAGVLGWEIADDPHDVIALLPNDDTGFRLDFSLTEEQKAGPNQMHFDLTSTSLEDQQQTTTLFCGQVETDAADPSDLPNLALESRVQGGPLRRPHAPPVLCTGRIG
jgi:hypothetical protein